MTISDVTPMMCDQSQVLTCPTEWGPSYRDYMDKHKIPYEVLDPDEDEGEAWFLLPKKFRPHAWKLKGPDE
jgi:hypothetical protein